MHRAIREGVIFHEGWGPSRVLGNGRVTGMELVRCEAVYDEEGNFNPRFDRQTSRTLAADYVILAIGQSADHSLIHRELEITGSGAIHVDPITLETSMPGVFAGGDIVNGAISVVQAIADGKTAADSIHRFLRGQDLRNGRERGTEKMLNPPGEGIPKASRVEVKAAPLKTIVGSFVEINQGYDPSAAAEEAMRCMTCGSRSIITYADECRQCRACEAACPVHAIAPAPIRRIEPHVKISDSLDDIAAWMGAEPDVLKATLEEYNTFCDQGWDKLFAKDRALLVPLRKPPYYAIRANSDFLDTIGGIKINEKMEVLDLNEKPIPGLYAAGVVAGGWQHDTYCVALSGASSAFAVNSRRFDIPCYPAIY